MKSETVHLIATLTWGIFGLTVGTLAVVNHIFNTDIMVTEIAAIVGNSAHLMALSLSKTGLTVSDQEKTKVN